jgi:hypothetical protein
MLRLWLRQKEQRLQEHTAIFNLAALKDGMIKICGSYRSYEPCSFDMIAKGNSNKVFLAIPNEKRLIVNIADPVVSSRLVTASEVATQEFARTEQGLPVPRVISSSYSRDSNIGCENISMDAKEHPLWATTD